MYPWQLALVKLHANRLGATPNIIQKFLRDHRFESPEKPKRCTASRHDIEFGEIVYVCGDGQSTYCSNLGCFLESLLDGTIGRWHAGGRS